MQEKGRKKNQEKRIILAFLREEAGIREYPKVCVNLQTDVR